MTKSVPILIFTGKTRGLWLGRVIGSVSLKQYSEKTSRWLTLTQPGRRLFLLDPVYMIHFIPSLTTAQLNFFNLSPSFCALPEIRLSFSKAMFYWMKHLVYWNQLKCSWIYEMFRYYPNALEFTYHYSCNEMQNRSDNSHLTFSLGYLGVHLSKENRPATHHLSSGFL